MPRLGRPGPHGILSMTVPRLRYIIIVVALLALLACKPVQSPPPLTLTVAAAANLSDTFRLLGAAFRDRTGLEVVFSFGSTAQLASQIEESAPFDVFASADVEHIDSLMVKGRLMAGTKAIYARGQLALWVPNGTPMPDLAGLVRPEIRFLAIAKPATAPYGKAGVQALNRVGLWTKLEPKVVYANNISTAKQFAASGNADAAFTAYSLVQQEKGTVLLVDPILHDPIDQALAVVADSHHPKEARQFAGFVLGAEGRAILAKSGYLFAH